MPPAQRICEAEWIGPRGNALPGPIFTFPKRHAKHGDTFYEPAMELHAVSRNPSDKVKTRVLAVLVHPETRGNSSCPSRPRRRSERCPLLIFQTADSRQDRRCFAQISKLSENRSFRILFRLTYSC